MLYQVLARNLQSFLARADERASPGLPAFVRRELYRYLDCGILANGFARVHCAQCGRDELVAFSCNGRGFCPSCCGRRMAETAIHLTDEVLPAVPIRQCVLFFPYPVRFRLAYDGRLCAAVRRIFIRTLLGWLRERAESAGVQDGRSGAVVVAQRFGSALNLNLHFHALVLDGVYASEPGILRPSPRTSHRQLDPDQPSLKPRPTPTPGCGDRRAPSKGASPQGAFAWTDYPPSRQVRRQGRVRCSNAHGKRS